MTVVIIGAGQGGFQMAASLREAGYEGAVTLVGEEPGLPYQRPPLSKAYMKGDAGIEQIELRPAAFYADHRIELVNARATRIDRVARRVELLDRAGLSYDHLVFATGARNRPLPVPGRELGGVFYLRTAEDADLIKAQMGESCRIVVVGAGFIGLEFAAVARALGHQVTVIEASARPLARAVSPEMSAFFTQAHEAMGTKLLLGAGVVGLHGEDGQVRAVETTDGGLHPADFVLVGIGVVPNVELAAEAGLEISNGIVVDAHLATSDPAISAIGDAVSYPSRYSGALGVSGGKMGMVRLESVQNAVDQARCLAARLAGKAVALFDAVPWFWSDQGDLKLQIVGLAGPDDSAVLRGDPASRRFSVFRFREDMLTAIESVNRPADHMLGRRLLAGVPKITPAQAGDEGFELKSLLAR